MRQFRRRAQGDHRWNARISMRRKMFEEQLSNCLSKYAINFVQRLPYLGQHQRCAPRRDLLHQEQSQFDHTPETEEPKRSAYQRSGTALCGRRVGCVFVAAAIG
jgi:hypothetical protein